MRALRRSAFTRYLIIPFTLVAVLSGCYKWSEPDLSPRDFIRLEEPSKVRLTLTDDRLVVLEHPAVTDSTISASDGDLRWVIPFHEVTRLEHRSFDWATFSIAVGLPIALITAGAIDCAQNDCLSIP